MPSGKFERVSVTSSARFSFSEPSVDDPPVEVQGSYWRHSKRAGWMRDVEVVVDIDGITPAEVTERLTRAGEGLSDQRVDVSVESHGYDDGHYAQVSLSGQRQATPDEIRWIEWGLKRQEREIKEREQAEIDRLKAARPELFKEDV